MAKQFLHIRSGISYQGLDSAPSDSANGDVYFNTISQSFQQYINGGWEVIGNMTSLTGDVTGSGPGATATTIANSAVTNAKMADMANNTVKANKSGGSAAPSDLALSDVAETGSSILTVSNGSKSIIGASNLTIKANLNDSNIYVGDGSNVPVGVSMSGDVTIDNTGATTVGFVGSSAASDVHTAELAANAATSSNTNSTIVKRDGSGNFTASTITAALTGTASGNTTITPSNHAVVLSSASNTLSTAAPTVTPGVALVSLGTSSDPAFGAINLASNSAVTGTLSNGNTTASSSNNNSAIVARDGSGNFSASTITASLTGTASGNTTYTANNHGIVVSSASNSMTVIAPDASTTKVLKSGGSSADPSWLAYDNSNTVSTLVFRDGSGNFSAGTITASLTGSASGNLSKITGDIDPTSFSAANNQSVAANVTGLAFANASVRSFEAQVSVYINATSSLYEVFSLRGVQRASDWLMSVTSTGDSSGVIFSITTAGQIQYSSANSSGWVSTTMKFRALTLPV